MATINGSANPVRSPWWGRLRLSLRLAFWSWASIGVVVGTQFRRESIKPRGTSPAWRPVAKLAKNYIWRIAWSRDRNRMGVVGWETPVEVRDAVSLKLLETIGDGKKIIHFAFGPKEDVVAYSRKRPIPRPRKILDRPIRQDGYGGRGGGPARWLALQPRRFTPGDRRLWHGRPAPGRPRTAGS